MDEHAASIRKLLDWMGQSYVFQAVVMTAAISGGTTTLSLIHPSIGTNAQSLRKLFLTCRGTTNNTRIVAEVQLLLRREAGGATVDIVQILNQASVTSSGTVSTATTIVGTSGCTLNISVTNIATDASTFDLVVTNTSGANAFAVSARLSS